MFRRCVLVFLVCAIQTSRCDKSSLAFVIDDTESMQGVINRVIDGANSITDIVASKRSSQILDYILVTFNDPDVSIKTITKNSNILKASLNAISAHGGGDCPELSLTGIEMALRRCRPGSYMYVFTDDGPKESNGDVIVERIKNLCQEKQIQIVIILTPPFVYCQPYHYTYQRKFNYYNEIAASSSGQVYQLNNVNEVTKILEIIKETVNGKRVVDKTETFPPNQLSEFKFNIDDQTDYVIVSTAGQDCTFNLIKGPTLHYEKKVWTKNVKAVKIIPSGDYAAQVNSRSNTSVVVFKRTEFSFEHGFSENPASSLLNTSKQSTLDKASHLLISIFDLDHSIRVKSIDILDLKGNILGNYELTKVSEDFYTTNKFVQPNSDYKIAVNGITSRNQPIQRITNTPISPYIKPVSPRITLSQSNDIEVPYDSSLSIACRVRAFPRPEVKWLIQSNNTILNDAVEQLKYPYLYRNLLVLEHIKDAQTLTCEAKNGLGTQIVNCFLNVKDPLKVVQVPNEFIKADYGKSIDLKCLVTSHLPLRVEWVRNTPDGKFLQIAPSTKYNMSPDKASLKINNIDLRDKGNYYCKVYLSQYPEKHKEFKTSIDIKLSAPAIKKNGNEMRKLKNSNIILSCSVLNGLPEPTVTWYFTNGNRVKTLLAKSNLLNISNASLENTGDYTCVAENVAGKDNYTIRLLIQETPKLEKGISNISVTENTPTEILCKSVEGVPLPKISCQFKSIGSHDFENIDCNHIQHIALVSTRYAGEYRCNAINEVGTDIHTIVVNVNVPPKIDKSVKNLTKHERTSIQLNCGILRGDPRPRVTWWFKNHDGVVTHIKKDSLSLMNLDLPHAGHYTCIAENVAGNDNHTIQLIIEAKPRIINKVTTFEAVLNDTVLKVPCLAVGYPTPNIIWTEENHTPIVNNDFRYVEKGVLVIKNLNNPTDKAYNCRATNEFGFDEKPFNVSISSNNNYNESDSNEVYILIGSSKQLNCSIQDDNHTYRWYKNGVFERVGAHYDIIDAVSGDSANYTCRIDSDGTRNAENDRTIVVYVGWSPLFEENRNATIEFDGGVITLSCDVRSKSEPFPTFTWTRNGVNLEGARSVLTVNDWGDYKCHVQNVHGSIEKHFLLKSDTICLIDQKPDSITNMPLILQDSTTLAVFKAREHFIVIESRAQLKFSCQTPNVFASEKLTGKSFVDAACEHEDKFIIDGQLYKFSELNCKEEIKPEIKRTGVKCMGDSDLVKIGFNGTDFVEVFEACIKDNNVIYTKLQLVNPNYDDSDYVDPFANLYINKIKLSESSSCQFVNTQDVPYGPAQKAVNDVPFNKILCSESKNKVTWNDVEEIVRKSILDNYDIPKITVWTGTKRLNTNDGTPPQYLWKVVKNEQSGQKIAIVFNNQENIEDLCQKTSQRELPTWIDYPAYPIYPCTLKQFATNVGIPLQVFT